MGKTDDIPSSAMLFHRPPEPVTPFERIIDMDNDIETLLQAHSYNLQDNPAASEHTPDNYEMPLKFFP